MTSSFTPRRLGIAAAAAIAAAGPLAAAPAQANGGTSATCTNLLTVAISPGFSLTKSSGTITSGGETGSIVCIGTIDGASVTGPGSIGLAETYSGGDCLAHVGTGIASVTLPTTAGPKHMAGAAISRRTGLLLSAEVDFPNAHFSGLGLATPTQGTCALSPMRQALLSVSGTLSGG